GSGTATSMATSRSRRWLPVDTGGTKPVGSAGEFLPTSFSLTSSLPRWRANFSLFYDGPADTWMQGLDFGAIVHFIGDYNDDNNDLTGSIKFQAPITGLGNNPAPLPGRARDVRDYTTLDLVASYTFNLPPPAPTEVPGLSKEGGKNVKMK